MIRSTIFSHCRKYRYTLWREWDLDSVTGCSDDLSHPYEFVQFIGLNPSTADEVQDDPTIRRCIAFAKAWGYGALCMTNIFAWRDTDPEKMKKVADPIGPDNDKWLQEIASQAGIVIAAWGKHGSHLYRGIKVKQMLPNLHHLKLNSDGSPAHPLYLSAKLKPLMLNVDITFKRA